MARRGGAGAILSHRWRRSLPCCCSCFVVLLVRSATIRRETWPHSPRLRFSTPSKPGAAPPVLAGPATPSPGRFSSTGPSAAPLGRPAARDPVAVPPTACCVCRPKLPGRGPCRTTERHSRGGWPASRSSHRLMRALRRRPERGGGRRCLCRSRNRQSASGPGAADVGPGPKSDHDGTRPAMSW